MPQTLESARDWRGFWNSDAAHLASDELRVQVGRTVGGQPISDGEIDLATQVVIRGLELGPDDVLLDLCCGNGLISRRLAGACKRVVGVDCSERLIEVARASSPASNVSYLVGAAEELDRLGLGEEQPTKLSIVQALQHLTVEGVERLLSVLDRRPQPITRIVLTDVPDAALVFAFYNTPERQAEFHRRRAAGTEAIGTWWDRAELSGLLAKHGYEAEITASPGAPYAHYRFDVVARRRG